MTFLRRFLVLLLLAVPALPPASAAAAETTTRTPVMGPSVLSADQLAAWYNRKRWGVPPRVPSIDNDVRRLAQIYLDEGRREGLRGDIAFVQSALETGWFWFSDLGQIRPTFNNFAGIFAYNGRPKGTTCEAEVAPSRCFPTAQDGIRAQVHLLRGYADASSKALGDRILLPPSDRLGVAPYWEQFGGSSGRAIWATAPDYGAVIVRMYNDALVFNGVNSACLPSAPAGPDQVAGGGYWVVSADGAVYPFGSAQHLGDLAAKTLPAPIVGAESNSKGTGYWLLGSNGGVYRFGAARGYGGTARIALNKPMVGMERTRSNGGYWLVATDGGIFAFGDAGFFGSTGAIRLNKPILGMERTRSGKGYWLFAEDGGIFAYGDATFHGSLGGQTLTAPVVGMQRTPSGDGYWMLTADGRVYAFGDARDLGGIARCAGVARATRLLVSPTGAGYWVQTTDGTVFSLGDARPLGFPERVSGPAVGLMLDASQ